MNTREDGLGVIEEAVQAVYPENAVRKALEEFKTEGNVKVLAVEEAAWKMAQAGKGSPKIYGIPLSAIALSICTPLSA